MATVGVKGLSPVRSTYSVKGALSDGDVRLSVDPAFGLPYAINLCLLSVCLSLSVANQATTATRFTARNA